MKIFCNPRDVTAAAIVLPFALMCLLFSNATLPAAENPPRIKRADAFLGIHFDFHAGPDCTEIGKNTTPEMIERIIDLVHPDYLQIDCKGHRGLTSYPTKVGNPAPGFVGDPLRVWREVTARRGVSLYMHYSGVWDSEAIIQHPDWAVRNANGSTNKNATSFFGPYADRLLIPQLRELAGEYRVNGAWIDGECWASMPDYGDAALKAFRETTGITTVPRKPSDANWYEFLQFNREEFRKYFRHYIAEVKKTNPEFELCSNWAFTDHMPEPVTAPLDFLSGDYSPDDSVNSARISARYLARQGKPWDLMAWSFSNKPGGKANRTQKSAVQLQREAAVVLALGGGFQAYHKQKRDGSIYAEQMPVMAEVAKFCRERQQVCHHAEAVPQVALLYSTYSHYREVNSLFPRDHTRMNGALQALLESQHSVELLGEHHLTGRLDEYPLVVVPEWEFLEAKFRDELASYVQRGGNLLLIGPKSAKLFEKELGATLEGSPQNTARSLVHGNASVPTKGLIQHAKLTTAKAFGSLKSTNGEFAAASIATFGKGKIAATYFSFAQTFLAKHDPAARDFLNSLARELFPSPLVEVRGSRDVDVCLARNHGKLLVNLVNTAGPHATESIIDAIPPVGPLDVTVRVKQKPKQITLEPAHKPVAFTYRDGAVRFAIPSLAIHDIVVIE